MRLLLNIFYPFYLVYAFATFVLGLFIVFPMVLLALPWGQPVGGNIVTKLARAWSDAWLFLIGIRHRNIEEAPIVAGEQYVFVANHISYMDIPLIFKAIRKRPLRVLGKMEMARIPIFGTVYRMAVILIDRSSKESRARSIQQLRNTLAGGVSIFIFPEGTFNETRTPLKFFYDGAFRLAIETGTPIKPIVFLDSVERMHYRSIFSIKPGLSRAVHLPPIPVAGLTEADVASLKEATFTAMEQCIRAHGGHYA